MVALANRVTVLSSSVNVRSLSSFAAASAHTAIQAALTGADTVYIPGNATAYTIGAKLTIPSNRRLIVDDGATLSVPTDLNTYVFENSGAGAAGNSNIFIEFNGKIVGNSANQSATSGCGGFNLDTVNQGSLVGRGVIQDCQNWGVVLTSCNFVKVRGLELIGNAADATKRQSGLSFGNCSNCFLDDLVIRDFLYASGSWGYGLYSAGSLNAAESLHRDCVMRNLRVNNTFNDCLVLFDCLRFKINDCVFKGSTGDKACHLSNARSAVIEDTVFSENAQDGCWVAHGGSVAQDSVIFRRCQFNYNTLDGVELVNNNGVYEECAMIGNTGRGMRAAFGAGAGNHIYRCRIGNNGLSGIEFGNAAAGGNLVEECRFFDNQTVKTQDYAVLESVVPTLDNYIINNHILPQATGYLSLQAGSDAVKSGNREVS